MPQGVDGVNAASAEQAAAVTKSDETVFNPSARGLYIGVAGDVAVRMIGGQPVTFVAVAAGSILPIQVDQVLSTGTSATNIVRMW